MKKTKIFIDGSEGTTGLRIYERFEGRDDIELLRIASELRKDSAERKRLINASDITFLLRDHFMKSPFFLSMRYTDKK